MQAHRLPPARGWAWVGEGFRLFRRNPSLLTFLIFTWWFIVVFANLIPTAGWMIATVCTPAFSVSLMNGCRAMHEGTRGGPELLFSGFRRNLPALLQLGVLYLLASGTVLLLTTAFDGGKLMDVMLSDAKPEEDTLHDPALTVAALAAMAFSVPVTMAFWFAPLLTAWHDVPPLKALFFSFVATARNWMAFLAYGAALLLVGLGLPALVLALAAQMASSAFPILRVAIALMVAFVLMPTVFATLFVSYRDVFGAPALPSETGGTPAE